MEQRTSTLIWTKGLLLALAAMLFCHQTGALAESEAITPAVVNRADLEADMKDAEKEYETTLKSRAIPMPSSSIIQSPPSLVKAVSTAKEDLLSELAAQVEALNSKLIVERTTLLATQTPRQVTVRGSRTVFHYSPEAVYEITASVNHVTDIQLKPGESLSSTPTSGDTARWNIAVMKSGTGTQEITHIIIKPLDDAIETNLIITTDAHTYHLKLRSSDFHLPADSWNYPEDFAAQAQEALKRKEKVEPTNVAPEDLHFDYEIEEEDYAWRPVRVFDDGKKTFIQMPLNLRTTEAPALFLIEEESNPQLVNYRVKGNFYIVDRLFQKAELRVGPHQKLRIEVATPKGFFERLFD